MEPFSIATGALQIAGGGLKLAQTLYAYIESVKKAEKWLKPVADHVKLTSSVVENLAHLLRQEGIRKLYTAALLKSTEDALDGCRAAFQELDTLVNSLFKPDKSGKIALTTSAKLTLNFRQNEIDLLQAHLERFKSSLDLVLAVLNLASSAKSMKDNAELLDMKLEIKRLIKVEEQAKEKEKGIAEAASRVPPANEDSKSHDRDFVSFIALPNPKQPPPYMVSRELSTSSGASHNTGDSSEPGPTSTSFVPVPPPPPELPVPLPPPPPRWPPPPPPPWKWSPPLPPPPLHWAPQPPPLRWELQPPPPLPVRNDSLSNHLHKCAEAIEKLASAIEQATKQWHGEGEYERQCFAPAFQAARCAVQDLSICELSLDFEANGRTYGAREPARAAIVPLNQRSAISFQSSIAELPTPEPDDDSDDGLFAIPLSSPQGTSRHPGSSEFSLVEKSSGKFRSDTIAPLSSNDAASSADRTQRMQAAYLAYRARGGGISHDFDRPRLDENKEEEEERSSRRSEMRVVDEDEKEEEEDEYEYEYEEEEEEEEERSSRRYEMAGIAEVEEERISTSVRSEIRLLKEEDIAATRNAARMSNKEEAEGRATLERLAAQGEAIPNAERHLDIPSNENRAAAGTTWQGLNRSMFSVHVAKPRTAEGRGWAPDKLAFDKIRGKKELREATAAALADSTQARQQLSETDINGNIIRRTPARSIADRAKYQFEADSEDEEMENEIDEGLDSIHRGALSPNALSRAMGKEIEAQNKLISSVIDKTDKVDDQIALNRARLDRIDGRSEPTLTLRKADVLVSRPTDAADTDIAAVDELLKQWTTVEI